MPVTSDGSMVVLSGLSEEDKRKTLHRLFTTVWDGIMKYSKAMLVQHSRQIELP
jgi:hypothetical protein